MKPQSQGGEEIHEYVHASLREGGRDHLTHLLHTEHHCPILYSTGKGGPSNSKPWARHPVVPCHTASSRDPFLFSFRNFLASCSLPETRAIASQTLALFYECTDARTQNHRSQEVFVPQAEAGEGLVRKNEMVLEDNTSVSSLES